MRGQIVGVHASVAQKHEGERSSARLPLLQRKISCFYDYLERTQKRVAHISGQNTPVFLVLILVSTRMDSVGAIIAALLVGVSLLAGTGIIHYSVSNTGDQATYSETFDPGTNQTHITLNESNRDGVYYSSTVDVTDENDSVMRPGIDYRWHQSNGTLTVLDGGGLDGDNEGTVEYSLRVPSSQQKSSATLLASWVNVSYAIPLVFVVALVVIAVGVLSNLS